MALNHTTYLNQGETGIPITVTVVDADKDTVDLTGKDVQFVVWKGSTVIIDEPMINENQISRKGETTYTSVPADSQNTPGTYRWKYVVTEEGSPDVIFEGPKTAEKVGGDFIIRKTV